MGREQDLIENIKDYLYNPEPLTLIDASDANVTYFGVADYGTLTSDTKWGIRKKTMNCTVSTSGGAIVISAVGSGTASIVSKPTQGAWDNRTSLTYYY